VACGLSLLSSYVSKIKYLFCYPIIVRLRNVKKTVKLGGREKLTDELIKKLTKYYRLGIRRNPESADEMGKAIMATFYPSSINQKPQHINCLPEIDSWCK
jgi:hypothetical protein